MWGRLEREIRLLPQVLACTVSDDEVVVLVNPAADPAAVEDAAAEVVTRDGTRRRVRVVGGTLPVPVGRARPWRSPVVLVGSVAATALIAVSSLVGGIGTTQEAAPPAERPRVTRSLAPAPAVPPSEPPAREPEPEPVAEPPVDEEPSPPAVVQPVPVVRVLPGTPRVRTDEPVRPPRPAAPQPAAPQLPPEPSPPPVAEPLSCHEPAARGAPREVRGRHRGNGPPPWSHSVLTEPHCERGRPR